MCRTLAFIDGQNLHYGTTKCAECASLNGKELHEMRRADCTCGFAFSIDHAKFRNYLKVKYFTEEAYYFLGYLTEENQDLYTLLQQAGFIVVFKEHHLKSISQKKGNIDVDLVFEAMKIHKKEDFHLLLVSGDGDYKKMVDYFIQRKEFVKIILPDIKRASKLYKKLGSEYFDHLTNPDVRKIIREK